MGPICSGKNPCTSQEQCIDQCDGAQLSVNQDRVNVSQISFRYS